MDLSLQRSVLEVKFPATPSTNGTSQSWEQTLSGPHTEELSAWRNIFTGLTLAMVGYSQQRVKSSGKERHGRPPVTYLIECCVI